MQTPQKRKNDRQDNLLEELLQEKAAVLSRAGMAVDDAIGRLMSIDREIEIKKSLLYSLHCNDDTSQLLQKKQLICEEINFSIEKFNTLHQKAELQYYYLIVTREALGLRRHEMVQKIYRIPDKKEKIKAG
jgi:hypothetical protein